MIPLPESTAMSRPFPKGDRNEKRRIEADIGYTGTGGSKAVGAGTEKAAHYRYHHAGCPPVASGYQSENT